jgi:protein disulfide isomerase
MRAVLTCAVAVLMAAAVNAAGVVDATDATFDEIVKRSELVLMEFYAPWCGHCKKLEPEFEKAAEELGDVATLAKIDATVEKENAGKHQIQGFPTIKVWRDGILSGNYEGGRTAADIVKYVRGNVGPAVKGVSSASEFEQLQKESRVLVALFVDAPAGEAFEAFESVAKSLRGEYIFTVVTGQDVRSAEEASANQVVVYKHFDDKKEVFSGSIQDSEALTTFVKNSGVPAFDEIGPHNYKSYVERKLPLVWIFATPADEAALQAGRDVAPNHKGKASFVWIDSSKYAGMAQRLGLSGDKFPAVAIDNDGEHYALPADQEVNTDNLRAFAESFVSGSLKPTVRTEEAPAEHTVNGLTTVVGTTFAQLIDESDVDVLIEFYAPWCGHCKQLAPTFEAVAKALESEPVRIAKIDATANDFPKSKYNVQGFPTIFWIPKGTHEPVTYEGGRTEQDLTSFIKGKLAA